MNIRFKISFIMGFIAAFFLIYSTVFHHSYINLSIATVLLIVLIYLFVSRILVKRIEKLNQQLNSINLHAKPHLRMEIKGKDEITDIAANINNLLDILESEHNKEPQNKIASRLLTDKSVFDEIITKTISYSKRQHKMFAVLFISLNMADNKIGNLNYDNLMNEIGMRLANILRSEDVITKTLNNEFIVLLADISKPKFSSIVAKKILQTCAQPLTHHSNYIYFTTSIGICIYPNDGLTLEALLKNGYAALSNAKKHHENTYEFFNLEMNNEAREFIKLESALHDALSNNEFSLAYQPKIHIKSGTITGVEALVRWNHPELGLIPPSTFIPLAEEIGMIMQIGEWILRETCKANKYWQNEGYEHMTVAVNLSAKQFFHPNLCQMINNILADTQLNPKYLELEISEKIVMDDLDASIEISNNIKALGLQISLDHFGTGHTSIIHLKQLPINVVKIDRSFIKGIPNIPDDMSITTALVELLHNLGLEAVAEGVETAEQLQFLTSIGCDIVQGYFLCHPLSEQKIITHFGKLSDKIPI